MLLVHGRLGPKSDPRENNPYHPQCTAHFYTFCVVSHSCKISAFGSLGNLSRGIHHVVAHETRKEIESLPRAIGTGTSSARDDEQKDYRKANVFGNPFSRFDSHRNPSPGIHSGAPQRERGSVPQAARSETLFFFSQKMTKQRHNSNADVCEKAFDHEFVNAGGITAELHGRTAQTPNIGAAIRLGPAAIKD